MYAEQVTVEFKEAGAHEWQVPSGVRKVLVTAIGGGASGEALAGSVYCSEGGETSSFGTAVVAMGGDPKKIPPVKVGEIHYIGGAGETSIFGPGGESPTPENSQGKQDGQGAGAGGASFTSYNLSGWGGGAGELQDGISVDVSSGEVIAIHVGKGGDVKGKVEEVEEEARLYSGRGADGCVQIIYIAVT